MEFLEVLSLQFGVQVLESRFCSLGSGVSDLSCASYRFRLRFGVHGPRGDVVVFLNGRTAI